jgi:hypothetical protein
MEDSSFNEIKSFFDAGGFVYVALTDGPGPDSDYRAHRIYVLEDASEHTFTFRAFDGLVFIYDGDYVSYMMSNNN